MTNQICARVSKIFPYCDRCQLNPDNHPEPIQYEQLTYPTTDPVSGDCQDFEESES